MCSWSYVLGRRKTGQDRNGKVGWLWSRDSRERVNVEQSLLRVCARLWIPLLHWLVWYQCKQVGIESLSFKLRRSLLVCLYATGWTVNKYGMMMGSDWNRCYRTWKIGDPGWQLPSKLLLPVSSLDGWTCRWHYIHVGLWILSTSLTGLRPLHTGRRSNLLTSHRLS